MRSIELTDEEISMIRYALNEMGNKRREQAIDSGIKHIYNESDKHFELAKKFSGAERAKP